MLIKRIAQTEIAKLLFAGHAIIVYGPRRAGKTTLVREIQKDFSGKSLYLNCDEPDVRVLLTNKTSTELANTIGGNTLVVIDEAQRVKNIGLTIKLIVDTYPHIQILATGSSSFDLSNAIVEPLTGRHRDFFLHGLSIEELLSIRTAQEEQRLLEQRLVYGTYPQAVTQPESAGVTLRYISQDYLYKDALEHQGLRNALVLEKLVTALALQIGQEVSYVELSGLLGIDKKTVERYIRILEQAFVVFRLPPYSKNPRKELSKTRKIFFWDNGIRNAVINNFNPLVLRSDTGFLWENYIQAERNKYLLNHSLQRASYFWRTYDMQEVDRVEENAGGLFGYEIKWKKQKKSPPGAWRTLYPAASWTTISQETYLQFLTPVPAPA